MLTNPRLKVCIYSRVTTRQDTLSSSLLELALKNLIATVCLCCIAVQSIFILDFVVMPTPVSERERWNEQCKSIGSHYLYQLV